MLTRLRGVAKVSGDLWFMPQTGFHLIVLATLMLAFLIELLRWRRTSPAEQRSLLRAAVLPAILVVAFLLSASAVLGAGGAVVSYHTVVVAIAIVSILFIYSVRAIVSSISAVASRPSTTASALIGAVTILAGGAAVYGNFEMNYLTMKLARNEVAYVSGIVRQAIDNHSKAIIVVDPRPFSLPEDHPVAYDQHGRAVPPYDLSCFSGPCLQNGAIFTIVAQRHGAPRGELPICHHARR